MRCPRFATAASVPIPFRRPFGCALGSLDAGVKPSVWTRSGARGGKCFGNASAHSARIDADRYTNGHSVLSWTRFGTHSGSKVSAGLRGRKRTPDRNRGDPGSRLWADERRLRLRSLKLAPGYGVGRCVRVACMLGHPSDVRLNSCFQEPCFLRRQVLMDACSLSGVGAAPV